MFGILLLLQVKDLEELCAAQQNSLEEGEEKFRALQDEQDQLHHTALAAKAQLVTAQAQVCGRVGGLKCALRRRGIGGWSNTTKHRQQRTVVTGPAHVCWAR